MTFRSSRNVYYYQRNGNNGVHLIIAVGVFFNITTGRRFAGETMLVCNIKKNLRGFSLDVNIAAKQGVTALMGASGSGKSMTLRCIAGVSKPDWGASN